MGRSGLWFFVSGSLFLQGCAVNSATFVTSTHVGIKADTKTEQISIGIGRADVFLGPDYPDKGTAPSAFGYLQTSGPVFSPHITQLYATGSAADAVSQPVAPPPPSPPSTPPDLSGERRPLVFGTYTNIGLKLGFVANAPSSISLGYDRQEVSVIPLQKNLTGDDKDIYAPVLASITMNVSTSTPSSSGLTLNQFFATGEAAVNLASNTQIRTSFSNAAMGQVSQAELQAATTALNQRVAAVKTYLDGTGGYATNCTALKAKPAFHAELWGVPDPCALSETAFLAELSSRPDLTSAAVDALPPTS